MAEPVPWRVTHQVWGQASHPRMASAGLAAQRHLPSVRGLALWLNGTLLEHNSCQDSVEAAVEAYGRFETVHRELQKLSAEAARILPA